MHIFLQAEDVVMRSNKIRACMLVAVILIDKRVGSFHSFFLDSFCCMCINFLCAVCCSVCNYCNCVLGFGETRGFID